MIQVTNIHTISVQALSFLQCKTPYQKVLQVSTVQITTHQTEQMLLLIESSHARHLWSSEPLSHPSS